MPNCASAPAAIRRRPGAALRFGWAMGCAFGTSALFAAPGEPVPALGALKKLSLEELMGIEVVSVSRHAEKLSQSASAIQVITDSDVRRSGATRLPEALRLADNLDVAQKNSHDWGISARGFNTELANKLLVMIDGRTVYTPLFSGVVWGVQDCLLEDLDRIEVISGPGGTLWGANAVNGVINIVTKSAAETQGGYVEAVVGTADENFAAARFGGALAPGVHFRIYGKYYHRGGAAAPSGSVLPDDWDRRQGGFRLDATGGAADALTLQGDIYSGHDGLLSGGRDTTKGGNFLGRWTHTLASDSDLRLQFYYDRTQVTQPVPALTAGAATLAPAGTFGDDLDTYDLDFQHRFRAGARHDFVWGLAYRFTSDETHNAPALGFLPPRLDHTLTSGFVQDEIAVRPDLTFTLGTKLEHNGYTGTEVEPSARVRWSPQADGMLWAAVSRAVRTPSRIDRDLSQGTPPNFVLLAGNPDFVSEQVVAYELGYRAELGRNVVAAVSTFYNDYDDVRSTAQSPRTIFPFVFQNNLEGETHGLEFTADWLVRPGWRLHAGYSLLKERLRVKPGATDINNALNETSDPAQRFAVRSSADLGPNVEFDAGLRWTDDRPSHNGATPGFLPSYWQGDARLAWRIMPQFEVSLVGQNLLEGHQPEYGFASPTRPEIRRRVYGKVAWRF